MATVNGISVYSEERLTIGYGYTNNSFPASITEADILTLTYYDTYGFPGAQAFDNSAGNISGYDEGTTYEGTNRYYFEKLKGQVTGTKTKVLETTTFLTSTNYYDDHYRVIQTLRDIYTPDAIYSEVASTLYDFPGKVKQTKQSQTVNSVTTTVDKYLTYDHAGRLKTIEQQIAGDATNGRVTVAENSYNEIGQLIDKKLHKAGSYNYLQSVDYTYNIRGWLTSINNPDALSTLQTGDPNIDLFGEKLLYQTTESGLNSSYTPQFNGNISAMVWNSTQKTKQGYAFTYDGLSRLTLGDHKDYTTAWVDNNNYEEKSLAYDKNGNINRLIRTNSTAGEIANYIYTYSGNKLSSINSGTAYVYGLNGNTTTDGLRGVTVAYNILNLPKTVSKSSDIISYIYSAAGEKLAKKMKDNTYQYYAGNMVYKNDKSLNYLLFEEGLVTKTSSVYSYEYHLKDHLGNTRVTFQPNGSTTTTTQVAEYYPFGSSYLPISPAGTNKYLYNGKEKQDDVLNGTALDVYDFHKRFYGSDGTRFWQIDPKAEKYYSISPYAYCADNPVKYMDMNGDTITVSDAFKNNKEWMTAYNSWSKTKGGQRFLKDYGVGGNNESVSVVFDIGEQVMGAKATTDAVTVDKNTGKETEIGSDKKLDNAANIVNGTDKNSYFRTHLYFFPGGTVNLQEGAEALTHESQHVRIDRQTLITDQMIAPGYRQHDWMRPLNSGWYQERYNMFQSLKQNWQNDYQLQLINGKVKNEQEYIDDKINNYAR